MRLLTATLALALAACGGSEADAARDRAAAQAGWVLVLKVDGAEVRLPLKAFNVLLFKDDEVAAKNPTVFEIEGDGVHLIGEIPPAGNPGYSEKWEKLKGLPLAIKASGEFHRETVDSKITVGGAEVRVTGGTMTVTGISGKWAGSEGDRTLKGTITLTLQDGRSLQGTFGVNAITWG
jgi:hypothetical protein